MLLLFWESESYKAGFASTVICNDQSTMLKIPLYKYVFECDRKVHKIDDC
jgi:hypothetical protein